MGHDRKIAVIGLGYVGLPVAVAFARSGVAVDRLRHQSRAVSRSCVAVSTERAKSRRTICRRRTCASKSEPARIAASDFYIVTVPTPIDAARRPDLGAMLAASRDRRRRAQARRHRRL